MSFALSASSFLSVKNDHACNSHKKILSQEVSKTLTATIILIIITIYWLKYTAVWFLKLQLSDFKQGQSHDLPGGYTMCWTRGVWSSSIFRDNVWRQWLSRLSVVGRHRDPCSVQGVCSWMLAGILRTLQLPFWVLWTTQSTGNLDQRVSDGI